MSDDPASADAANAISFSSVRTVILSKPKSDIDAGPISTTTISPILTGVSNSIPATYTSSGMT